MKTETSFARRGAANKMLPAIVVIVCVILVVGVALLLKVGTQRAAAPTAKQAAPSAQVQEPATTTATGGERTSSRAEIATPADPPIRGRVLARDTDAPIPGARISLYKKTDIFADWPEFKELTTSAADGTFTLPADTFSGDRTGINALYAEAEGYESKMLGRDEEQKSEEILFKLGPGGFISGRVTNEAGNPIQGVEVGGDMLGAGEMMTGGMAAAMKAAKDGVAMAYAKTDTEGRYRLTGLTAGKNYRVPFKSPRYLTHISDETPVGTQNLDAVLKLSSGRVYGHVYDADGKGVAGAAVMLFSQGDLGGDMLAMMAKMKKATTDKEGAYKLEGVKEGSYMLMAQRDPTASGGGQMAQVSLTEGEEKEVDVKLPRAFRITGRAINIENNQGIAGIRVSSQPMVAFGMMRIPGMPRPPKSSESVTAGDGSFILEEVSPSGPMLVLYYKTPPGFTPEGQQMMEGQTLVQMKADGTPPEVELRFHPAAGLRGIVYQSDGSTPAGGVTVKLEKAAQMTPATTTTAETGRFIIDAPYDKPIVIRAESETAIASQQLTLPSGQTPPELKLVLQQFASVSGHVRDEEGNPLKGVSISAHSNKDVAPGMFDFRAMMNTDAVLTDDSGAYLISKVEPGDLRIAVNLGAGMMPGFNRGGGELAKYTAPEPIEANVDPGGTLTNQDFTLELGDVFDGIVKDSEGTPIKGASLTVMGMSRYTSTTSDEAGKFSFAGIGAEEIFQLNVSHPEYAGKFEQDLTTAKSPHEIILTKKVPITLVVVTEGGQPVSDFEYKLGGSEGAWVGYPPGSTGTTVRGSNGTTKITVSPGTVRIEVKELIATGKETGRIGADEFSVEAGDDEKEFTVKIGGGRKVTGVVTRGEGGPPVPGATIFASRVNMGSRMGYAFPGYEPMKTTTDGSGRFTFEPVLFGKQYLSAQAEGLFSKSAQEVTVPRDKDPEPVTLVLYAGGSIFGQVIGTDGAPAADVTVEARGDFYAVAVTGEYVSRSSENTNKATTDADGRYRIDNLAGGRIVVIIDEKDRGMSNYKTLDMEAEQSLEVNFDFSSLVELSGTFLLNGKPLNSTDYSFMMAREGGGDRKTIAVDQNGRYTQRLQPGRYSVFIQPVQRGFIRTGGGSLSLVDSFDLTPEPRQQTRDFNIDFVDANVVLVFPTDQDFTPGDVSVAKPVNDVTQLPTVGSSTQAARPNVQIKSLPAGEYKATYRSRDGEWYGVSAVVKLTAGGENILIVDVRKPPFKEAIGNWNIKEPSELKDYDFDVSLWIKTPGEYDVLFEYQSGDEALAIESVVLLCNGSEVSRDAHAGWAGYARRDHVYRLQVPSITAGANYQVRCRYRANGISNGGIFLAHD